MRLLLLLGLLVLMCGPLRPWVGRHWALLISVIVGAGLGLLAAAWVMATTGQVYPHLTWLFAALGAIACGKEGPAVLRHLQKDGKDHGPTIRH